MKILLNACCAPDATHSINVLRDEGFEVITFFYNPNIHPESEYLLRVKDMEKLARETNVYNIESIPYDDKEWFEYVKEFKDEKEGGKRCELCFRFRMEKTAQKARELGIEIFATTLTISPHKNAALINRLGKETAAKYGIKYFESDFKKKDGFKKSIELSRKHGLYRQDYCGCVYSFNEKKNRGS